MKASLSTLAWLAAAVLVTAQEPPRQTFRSGTDLVRVTATVVDERGRAITGLTKDVFSVFENDTPQEIAFFNVDEATPVSIAIAIDTSGSMVDKLDDVQDAVRHFLDLVRSDDEVTLLRFNDDIETVVEPDEGPDRARRAVGRLRAGGGTALYDAVVAALAAVEGGRHRKKAVLLVTDGNDTASSAGRSDAVRFAAKMEVLLYALGIGHSSRGSFGHGSFGHADRVDADVLRDLAEPTGGRSFVLEEAHRGGRDLIDEAVTGVARELRLQYTLGYYPSEPVADGSFRRIKVITTNRNCTVRARSGYIAGR